MTCKYHEGIKVAFTDDIDPRQVCTQQGGRGYKNRFTTESTSLWPRLEPGGLHNHYSQRQISSPGGTRGNGGKKWCKDDKCIHNATDFTGFVRSQFVFCCVNHAGVSRKIGCLTAAHGLHRRTCSRWRGVGGRRPRRSSQGKWIGGGKLHATYLRVPTPQPFTHRPCTPAKWWWCGWSDDEAGTAAAALAVFVVVGGSGRRHYGGVGVNETTLFVCWRRGGGSKGGACSSVVADGCL